MSRIQLEYVANEMRSWEGVHLEPLRHMGIRFFVRGRELAQIYKSGTIDLIGCPSLNPSHFPSLRKCSSGRRHTSYIVKGDRNAEKEVFDLLKEAYQEYLQA